MDRAGRLRQTLARTAWVGCVLMAVIIAMSAYLRLRTVGIGCEPWPQCYGRLLEPSAAGTVDAMWIARLLHRFAATAVALLAVLMLGLAMARSARTATNVIVSIVIIGLTTLLAVVGRQSAGSVLPLVGVVNLLGGFALLALFWLLWLRNARSDAAPLRGRAVLAVMAVLLAAQIAVGALVSLSYSASACTGVLECATRLAAAAQALIDLPLSAPLELDAGQRIVAPAGAAELQLLHRSAGLVLGGILAACGVSIARRGEARGYGLSLEIVAVLEVLLGLGMVLSDFPLWAALMHNAGAALLLMILLSMLHGLKGARRGG